MTVQSHIQSLEQKHERLEDELRAAATHPGSSDQSIADIKRRKLRIKDEINRLKG